MNPLEDLVAEAPNHQKLEVPIQSQENFKSKTKLDEVAQAALNIFTGGRVLE